MIEHKVPFKQRIINRNFIMKNLLVAITFILLIVTSCGENVDPAKGDINIQMKAVTELAAINANARTAEMDIEFTEVILGVTEIELEGWSDYDDDHNGSSDDDSDDNGDDDGDDDHSGSNHDDSDDDSDDDGDDNSDYHDDFEIEFEGRFVVDLLNGTSDPDFGISSVFPGEYKELEIKVSPILDDGNSISIKFNIKQEGSDPLLVELSTSKAFELEIEHDGGIQVDVSSINQILVLFDLDEILANLDLSSLDPDEDGVVRINENSNSAALLSIWQSFHYAFDACEDNDDDDEFDDHDHHNHD